MGIENNNKGAQLLFINQFLDVRHHLITLPTTQDEFNLDYPHYPDECENVISHSV